MNKIVAQVLFAAVISLIAVEVLAAKVTVDLGKSQGVSFVGAIQRWDEDGNHRKLPDPKAQIGAPVVDATALDEGNGQWVFKNLPKGKYDLVILGAGGKGDSPRLGEAPSGPFRQTGTVPFSGPWRIEGFQFVPVHEFDPFFPPDMGIDEETREFVLDHIKKSPQYENVVEPLYLVGDKKVVRVLMMLLRNKPTTYNEIPNAATLRHEVWQYSSNYGGWQKDKRTKVIDRVIMNGDELRRWTWLWDPKLGGINVASSPVHVRYQLPAPSGQRKLKGLYPY